eukprot:TRINITY_DN106317_c0_g1_i1.p1 TRINITY_DN106317_c0_g1~~TRINITY_DN106317_c0_g1_i1.p1  ORF type:complete len:110 (-),score=13.13 TRINITY_DN106317_c0_g1_i1:45-374(-)
MLEMMGMMMQHQLQVGRSAELSTLEANGMLVVMSAVVREALVIDFKGYIVIKQILEVVGIKEWIEALAAIVVAAGAVRIDPDPKRKVVPHSGARLATVDLHPVANQDES